MCTLFSISNELGSCFEIRELHKLNIKGDGTISALRPGCVRRSDGGSGCCEIGSMTEV